MFTDEEKAAMKSYVVNMGVNNLQESIMQNLSARQLEDTMYLRETMRWARWPLCPVKRSTEGEQQIATVWDSPDGFVVLECNMLSIADMSPMQLKAIPRTVYKNTTDVVLAGWMVD